MRQGTTCNLVIACPNFPPDETYKPQTTNNKTISNVTIFFTEHMKPCSNQGDTFVRVTYSNLHPSQISQNDQIPCSGNPQVINNTAAQVCETEFPIFHNKQHCTPL